MAYSLASAPLRSAHLPERLRRRLVQRLLRLLVERAFRLDAVEGERGAACSGAGSSFSLVLGDAIFYGM